MKIARDFSVALLIVGVFLLSCCRTGTQSKVVPPPAVLSAPAVPHAQLSEWPDSVLYFVIVDRFADGDPFNNQDVDPTGKGTFHGGDLKGLLEHLDEISSLGVTALWITPVVKNIPGFVTGAGFPDWPYHGYWTDDFTSMDSRFGTEEQLKALEDECEKRGIHLLLDVVYNHVGYGSQYLTNPKTKGWFRTEEAGTCGQDDVTSCVAGLPDLKTELPEVDEYLFKAQLGRASRVGLHGFRLDTVKHVSHEFWKEHRERSRAELGPDFFLLGEVWGGDAQVLDPWFADDEMDAGFDFSFQGNVLGFIQGRGRTVAFDHYLKSREKVRPGYLLSQFLSSHDVPGALYQLQGNTELFRLAAVLEFTTLGVPMIYYGEEVGRVGGDWPENRSDMPWGGRDILPGKGKPRDEQLRRDYQRLISIRKQNRVLSRGTHRSISSEGDLLLFARQTEEPPDCVVVAINRGTVPATAVFSLPTAWQGKKIRDVWNEKDVVSGAQIELLVEARGAAILAAE